MDWDRLGRQLGREARDYLADLRDIREGLRLVEGWIALGLVVVAVAITAAWAIVSLGFSPPNEHVTRFIYKLGLRPCRPVDNVGGVIIFINLFLLLFLTLISLGNVVNLIGRVKRGLPREPRDLIVSTSLMLAVGIGGIIYMRQIC
jgi:amino acid transporter